MLKDVYLAGPARTAVAVFQGAFSEVPAPKLGAAVVKAALERAGVPKDQVEELIMGNVLPAGLGQNVGRQCAIYAGLPNNVTGITVNKVCGSGLKAVMLAAQGIQCGDASVIVAGGCENMTRAPYVLPKARGGYRMGNGEIIDTMIHDGLWDIYNNQSMGTCGDKCAAQYNLTRQEQDDFAATSYKRAIAANKAGLFKDEIVPIDAPAGKATVSVTEDENLKK